MKVFVLVKLPVDFDPLVATVPKVEILQDVAFAEAHERFDALL